MVLKCVKFSSFFATPLRAAYTYITWFMKQWVNFESSVAQFLRFISIELVFLSKTTFSKRISLNVINPI